MRNEIDFTRWQKSLHQIKGRKKHVQIYLFGNDFSASCNGAFNPDYIGKIAIIHGDDQGQQFFYINISTAICVFYKDAVRTLKPNGNGCEQLGIKTP